ncbi:hypothetical protein FOF52_00015 [Thermobifida alba]|uniref:DUF4276 family protein n=1 Tax=Thermobifida alba TaxID=53522 RepID=A0ABY4KVV0_THEAE|nr:hypothetical protein FOF52_00015 [Thermobifida alba]
MSRRGGTSTRATRKPVVVVAGEDRNDRASLRILLEEICPEMRGRIVEIKDKVRLREATGSNLRDRVDTLARKVRARAKLEQAEVACVFIHEDLDAPESRGYSEVHQKVERELRTQLDSAHYVLAVAEMEAWMLLFPQALTAMVSTWKLPAKHQGRDTGRITDPKKILMGELGKGKRRYRESDASDVFRTIVDGGHLASPKGSNRSWDRFCSDARECGSSHLRVGKG